MADPMFQVDGVSSGIAWADIINKTLEQGRKPAKVWENKIDTLEYKRSLYQELSGTLFTLRSSLTKLKLSSTYKKKAAEFVVHQPSGGDANSVVKATVNADAEISKWSIKVNQLAAAQRHISKRVDNPSGALGLTGSIRLQVGVATAVLELEESDTIRTINQKINQLRDQEGNQLAVTAKLIDNRLVIESALTGKNNEDKSAGDTLSIADAIKVAVDPKDADKGQYALMYLPRAADVLVPNTDPPEYVAGTYPPQLYELKVSGTTNYFREGTDYVYNADEGLITWLPGGRWPSETDTVQTTYMFDSKLTAGNAKSTLFPTSYTDYDLLPALPTGATIDISDRDAFEIYINDGKTKLEYGTDYTILNVSRTEPPTVLADDDTSGIAVVHWLDPTKRPADNKSYTLRLGANVDYSVNNHQFYMSEDGGRTIGMRGNNGDFTQTNYDLMPGGALYDIDSGIDYEIVSLDGKKTYVMDTDFELAEETDSNGQKHQVIKWINPPADGESYVFQVAGGVSTSPNRSLLNQLGFTKIIEDPSSPGDMISLYDQYENAQDALLNVNGVDIVRFQNEISDDAGNAIIANVKLELTGVGYVTMDITQDASEAVEAMNKFVESYNAVMEWVNTKLEEKYNANTIDEDDDYLQSILSESRGSTVFGPLHGDQLLWSIKNQMRTNLSSPVASLSNTVRTKKYTHTNTALSVQGSFYVNAGGKVARIDVAKNDTLEDIQKKLNYATSINNGANKDTKADKDMGLNVEIVDGQLVIKTMTGSKNTGKIEGSPVRATDSTYDLLDFVPNLDANAINGNFVVESGKTTFAEGVDYRLETVENDKGVLESRIVWLATGQSPTPGAAYNVTYEYNPTAIAYEFIPYSGDLSSLNLHYDSSNIQLSTLGVATESFNYGKSGEIEFDEEKFFDAIKSDSQLVSNVMVQFMKDLDGYIGNLVDSSNVVVGGQIVTKGRIAAALNSIDSEVNSLSQQITKLEKQLADRQTALYKQYSSMEQAIQKMNAQMSSISQYFSQSSK